MQHDCQPRGTDEEIAAEARQHFARDITRKFKGWRRDEVGSDDRSLRLADAYDAIQGSRAIAGVLGTVNDGMHSDGVELLSRCLVDGMRVLLRVADDFISSEYGEACRR